MKSDDLEKRVMAVEVFEERRRKVMDKELKSKVELSSEDKKKKMERDLDWKRRVCCALLICECVSVYVMLRLINSSL